MAESYCVRVGKDQHVFSAGHFITYDGDTCERLHGHNYRAAATVWGPLDENHYVIDFIALRDSLAEIVNALDHRMLLPTQHAAIRVDCDDREVVVTFQQRRWVFPRGDCVLLPVPNTTSEMLATYIGRQLIEKLLVRTGSRPHRVRVDVDECFGQIATAEIDTA